MYNRGNLRVAKLEPPVAAETNLDPLLLQVTDFSILFRCGLIKMLVMFPIGEGLEIFPGCWEAWPEPEFLEIGVATATKSLLGEILPEER